MQTHWRKSKKRKHTRENQRNAKTVEKIEEMQTQWGENQSVKRNLEYFPDFAVDCEIGIETPAPGTKDRKSKELSCCCIKGER